MCGTRSVNLALVVFAVVLLVGTVVERSRTRAVAPASYQAVTIVDVAHGVEPGAVPSLLRLRVDERVVAVDDQAVENDLAAGAAIAEHAPGPGKFLDLTVGSATGNRRVLVLMH